MKLCPQQSLALITVLAVFSYATTPQQAVAAEPHVVSLSELRQEMTSAHNTRAKNLEDIGRVLSLPAAESALAKAHVTKARVQTVIAGLNDQELSRLADRARIAERDVEGGFIVGLLALIGLVVVILIVVAATRD